MLELATEKFSDAALRLGFFSVTNTQFEELDGEVEVSVELETKLFCPELSLSEFLLDCLLSEPFLVDRLLSESF